jgi:hypothetical protein
LNRGGGKVPAFPVSTARQQALKTATMAQKPRNSNISVATQPAFPDSDSMEEADSDEEGSIYCYKTVKIHHKTVVQEIKGDDEVKKSRLASLQQPPPQVCMCLYSCMHPHNLILSTVKWRVANFSGTQVHVSILRFILWILEK